MQALDAGPRTIIRSVYCACAYECLAAQVDPCLYLACFTPVAPVATTFDPPVALHVAAVFRWSRNCAKMAFSRHNF